MAEYIGRDLRVNELVDSLTTLRTVARGRISATPPRQGYTTAPDGSVLDPFGRVIYKPTPVKTEGKK